MVGPWFRPRFWCAVSSAVLLHLTLGTIYTWGNMTPYVTATMRSHGHELDYADTSAVFSAAGFSLGCAMYFGGRLTSLCGCRVAVLIGGWTASLGVMASSMTVKLGLLPFIFTYGVMFGLGAGLCYTAPMVCLMNWMPDRRGLASGMVFLASGWAAAVFNGVQVSLVNPVGLTPETVIDRLKYFDWEDPTVQENVIDRVPGALSTLACIYAVMQLASAILLFGPLDADIEAMQKTEEVQQSLIGQNQVNHAKAATPDSHDHADALLHGSQFHRHHEAESIGARQMVRTVPFWLMFANFAVNTQVIFFSTNYGKILAETAFTDVTETDVTAMLSIASIFNGLGRLTWGSLGDAYTFRKAMMTLCVIQAITLAIWPMSPNTIVYTICMMVISFCSGGNFSLFPAAVGRYYGPKNVGSNYGVMFMGFSLSMLCGPMIAKVMTSHFSVSRFSQSTALIALLGSIAAFSMPDSQVFLHRMQCGHSSGHK